MHDPAIQRDHVFQRTQVRRRLEAAEVRQQEARGVADAAVDVGVALEDVVRHRHLVAVVGRGDPQAQHVGAHRVDDLLRLDRVAERLRHLLALLVDGEAVRQHLAVRRHAVHRHAGEQRAVEPAAMLVGAFQVQVGRLVQPVLRTLREHALVADARIEPDVEDVGHLLVVRGLIARAVPRRSVRTTRRRRPVRPSARPCASARANADGSRRSRDGRTARSARPSSAGARCVQSGRPSIML